MSCTSALETLLTPIDSVSTGVVSELSHTENVQELFIDAAAGGQMGAATNPRIYLSLSTGTRVDITDVDAPTSSGWDLALKRPVIFTNSGDAGPGEGGAVYLDKSFDEVTTADLANNTLSTESFVDAECNPKYDASGAVLTTFSDWYDYDPATHVLTPKTGTYLVKGASGSRTSSKSRIITPPQTVARAWQAGVPRSTGPTLMRVSTVARTVNALVASVMIAVSAGTAWADCPSPRPTDPGGYFGYSYGNATVESFASDRLRIWYATTGAQRVDLASTRADGVPDCVAYVSQIGEDALTHYESWVFTFRSRIVAHRVLEAAMRCSTSICSRSLAQMG